MKWLQESLEDLERLHRFLIGVSPEAAKKAIETILEGADKLEESPHIGKPQGDGRRDWYVPFGAGAYVLRYRIDSRDELIVLRVWHSRESRE